MGTTLLFIGGPGPTEMIVIFVIFVLLFGAKKLPGLARSSGEAMGEFKRGRDKIEAEIADARENASVAETNHASQDRETETDASIR